MFAEQRIEVRPRQAPDRRILYRLGAGDVRRLGDERSLADDLAWTEELQHAVLAHALADEHAEAARLDQEERVGRLALTEDRLSDGNATSG